MKTKYIGGGIVVYELYTELGSGFYYPAIVLGEEMYGRQKGKYADFGGGVDKADGGDIEKTIMREAKEELYLDLGSVKMLPKVELFSGRKGNIIRLYQVRLVRINNLDNYEFQKIRKFYLEQSKNKYSPWVEIGRIRHFFLYDIYYSLNNGLSKVRDSEGVWCELRPRMLRILKKTKLLDNIIKLSH